MNRIKSMKRSNKLLLAGLVIILSSAFWFNLQFSAGGNPGERVSRIYDLRDYRAVDIRGSYAVEITRGDQWSLTVEDHSEVLDNSPPYTVNGTLLLDNSSYVNNVGAFAVITMPHLEKIECSGGVEITGDNLQGKLLEIDSAGASEITLTGPGYDEVEIDTSGVGSVDFPACPQKT